MTSDEHYTGSYVCETCGARVYIAVNMPFTNPRQPARPQPCVACGIVGPVFWKAGTSAPQGTVKNTQELKEHEKAWDDLQSSIGRLKDRISAIERRIDILPPIHSNKLCDWKEWAERQDPAKPEV